MMMNLTKHALRIGLVGLVFSLALFADAPSFAAGRARTSAHASGMEVASCSLSDVTGVTFPLPYNPFLNLYDYGTGHFTITCTNQGKNGTTVQVQLSEGDGDSYDPREMDGSGTAKLNYNLYAGPDYQIIWGDGTGKSHNVQHVVKGSWTATIYGRIFNNQPKAEAGAYSDTITITVSP
jgi:spore coat protein U-like protein